MNELRDDIPRKILQILEDIERSLGIPDFPRESLPSFGNMLVSLVDRLPEKTGIGSAQQILSALSDPAYPAEDLRTLLGKMRDEISMETIEIQILPEEGEAITLSDVDLTLEISGEIPVPEPVSPIEKAAEEIPMPEMETSPEIEPVAERTTPQAESGETGPDLENVKLELGSSEPEPPSLAPEPIPESPPPPIESAPEEIPLEAETDRVEAAAQEVHQEEAEEDEFDMSELIPEFIQGARDNIEIVSAGLLDLENNPEDKENIEKVFRHCHSLKGSSQVIGFHQIGEVAHAMEDLMRDIHEGKNPVTPETLDLLLQGLDTIRSLVDHLASDSSYLADIGPVLALLKGQASAEPAASVPKPASEKKPEAKPKPPGPAKSSGTFQDTIRVSIGKLDTLMNLAGELVSTRNWLNDELKTLASHAASRENGHNGGEPVSEIRNVFDELDRLVDEFSERILDIRLMPVSTVFSSLPRLVRDLSRKMHKEIQFVMRGEETLLDRKILEAIGDPLVHLIKNSIDHGIELPDDRERSGKGRAGLIDLSADQKEGKVLIRIRDDGKGIDPDGIRKSAVGKGILTQEEADRMSPAEAIGLIFKPGFSTKTEVSEVSGRGVGMDAVKSNIEGLRGTVHIQSEKGKGSEMTIVLPLSLATTRVILVRVGDETMGIPALFVDKSLRVSLDQLVSENGEIQILLDGVPCPYYDLEEAILKRPVPKTGQTHASALIIKAGQTFAAFGVNDILEEREVIIKSLGKNFQNAGYLLGGTTLGRGQVVLVLDIVNLLESL